MEAELLEYLVGKKIYSPNRDRDETARRIFAAARAGHEAARQVSRYIGSPVQQWDSLPDSEKKRILTQAMMIERHEGVRHLSVSNVRPDTAARLAVICASLGYTIPRY